MNLSDLLPKVEPQELYAPVMAEIKEIRRLTSQELLYRIELPGGADLGHQPGQFVEVSIFGVGEAPFSVSSSPTLKGSFELGVRKAGMLTDVMTRLKPGTKLGIRGPFGKGVDVEKFKGRDVLIVAGGIGLVPMRSLINYVRDRRDEFGRLIICYGTRTPQDLLFRDELARWDADPHTEYHVTVDQAGQDWRGRTGVITTLIPHLELDLTNTACCVCGPPVMYRYALLALKSRGLSDQSIYLSLERRMKCGVGKCGHCQINHSYVCQDGPVYHYPELRKLQEAF
jgi:NAD(P)H-flavin reductase